MQNHLLFNLRSECNRTTESQQCRGERHLAQTLFARTPAKFTLRKPHLGGVILPVMPQDSHKAAAFFLD